MVIPLKKHTQEGEPYRRRVKVENQLEEFGELTPDQLVENLTSSQQPVPFEVLIYFLRHPELELSRGHLEPIFHAFYGRLDAALRKTLPDASLDRAADIREEIIERILEMIAKDRSTQEDKMYYWEINFNHALANLRKDVLRDLGPARETDPLLNAAPLMHEGEDGHEVSPEVDFAAADFINPNPSKLDDLIFRSRLMDAINHLPDEEKRAIGLFLQGIQIESKDPKVMTIARALECTDRTVRNRLNRAYEKLRVVLQAEDN